MVASFSNEFLAGVTEAGQATVDTCKYENKDQHYHLQGVSDQPESIAAFKYNRSWSWKNYNFVPSQVQIEFRKAEKL